MNRLRLNRHVARTILLLAPLVLIVTASYAAYLLNRPVALADEPILQTYLYGELSGTAVHKGVDFSAGVDFGDSVYAIAPGTVTDIAETKPDNCHPWYDPRDPRYCTDFGNYVLIQHDTRHYDRVSGQMAFVYSLYLHLRQNQVFVTEGQHVNAGTLIAQADNTGNSSGHHLHLQIVLHPQPNREIEPVNTLESETRSRNPELWLSPYNGTTGTVVGKVTNTNGDPVGGRYICGLQKQPGWGYGWNVTYNFPNLNPDDILVENWGTTDVTPGTYTVYSCPPGTCTSNCISMGTHTVRAGRITYVGLFPVWLPHVRGSGTGWNSTIYVRNNSGTYRAQLNTTYFDSNGIVQSQRRDYINTNATLALVPPAGFNGSAMVVSSEDVSVVVRQDKSGVVDIDNGFTATGSSAFERADTTLYVPGVYANSYNVNSTLHVMNTGTTIANVTIYLRGRAGYPDATRSTTIPPNGRYTLNANSVFASAWVGSAKLSSTQPVALRVYDEFIDGATRTANGVSGGSTLLYAPALYKAAFNLTSGVVVQNIGSTSTNVTVEFYNRNGTLASTYSLGTVGAERAAGVSLANVSGLPTGWYGSARIVSSGQPIAAMITTDMPGAGVYAYTAADSSSPKSLVYLPRIAKQASGRTTSFLILNTSTSTSLQVSVLYYTTSGSLSGQFAVILPPRGSAGYYQGNDTFLPSGWEGSVLLQANSPLLVAVLREELSIGGVISSLGGANGIGR